MIKYLKKQVIIHITIFNLNIYLFSLFKYVINYYFIILLLTGYYSMTFFFFLLEININIFLFFFYQ